jgi:hypothetical protein
MKIILLLFTLIIPLNSLAQLKGVVLDKKTKEPIEFSNIWVEDKFIGTTSDFKGKFEFPDSLLNNNIIVSAIGYEKQRFNLSADINKIILTPKSYEIEKVVVKPQKRKTKKIGKFKTRKIEHYYSCGAKPWIAARYYKYNPRYEKTPFLSHLDIMTINYTDSAIFGLRLLSVDENGKPGDDLLEEPLVVNPEKGKGITQVDLSRFNIKFPKEGFFIATEFYVIDRNLYIKNKYSKKEEKKIKVEDYGPLIGNILERNYENSWVYVYGEWRKPFKINSPKRKYKNKYWNLAISVNLTN